MFVRELMTQRVVSVGLSATIDDMRGLIQREDLLVVAVVHRHQPLVVLTRQALARWPNSKAADPGRPWVEHLGGQRPVVLAPDDLVADVEAILTRSGASLGLVIDHRDIVGVVTLDQL
jgi:CBS domain-containing protein